MTLELPVGDRLVLEEERGALGMLERPVGEEVREVHERRSRRATSVCGARMATSSC